MGEERNLLHVIVDSFDPGLKVLKFIVDTYQPQLNLVDRNGNTPFLLACRKGGLDKVQFLEQKEADIYAKNSIGDNALMMAAQGGSLEIVQYLHLKEIYSIDEVNQENQTALDISQQKGNIEVVEYLISVYEKIAH